jgi:hypothetical protein
LPAKEDIKGIAAGRPLTFGFAELYAPSIDRKYVIALKIVNIGKYTLDLLVRTSFHHSINSSCNTGLFFIKIFLKNVF